MEEETQSVEKKDPSPPRGRARGKNFRRYPFDLKLKAVRMYVEEGFSGRLIAQETGISQQSLSGWVRVYRQLGEQGLKECFEPHHEQPKLPSPVAAQRANKNARANIKSHQTLV